MGQNSGYRRCRNHRAPGLASLGRQLGPSVGFGDCRSRLRNARSDRCDRWLVQHHIRVDLSGRRPDPDTWVQGNQFTGRVVTVSNKSSFTESVYNYSSYFEYIWEEIEVAVPHHGDWEAASMILERQARRQSASEGARQAMTDVRRRFPVPAAEVEPKVFASADEGYMRLAVRFVVPIRSARTVKDDVIRRIHSSLEDAGIEIVATSVIQTASNEWQPVSPVETNEDDTDDAGNDGLSR